MRLAFGYLSLIVAFPFCACSQTPQEDTPPAITVYTQFAKPYSAISLDEMKHEMAAIMSPLGLDFSWRSLKNATGSEVSAELVVVTFQGSCEMDDVVNSHGGNVGALGWTHVSDGTVLPFSDVDCDKIRRFIAPEVRGLDSSHRSMAYGRAIGRVLAHELYHVFTNTTRHASWGVAKSCYSSHDLVADHFEFQEKDTKALRNGNLKALLRNHRQPVSSFSGAGQ